MAIDLTPNLHHAHRRREAATMRELLAPAAIETVRAFHRSIPVYRPTPLVALPRLAHHLGVASILIKDESQRFGLNAFKALGGSYTIALHLADRLGMDIADLDYEHLVSPEVREELGDITLITATDGNHGRGVAWTAQKLGVDCVVHMPKGSTAERLENIRALGARADITELNYDDAVRLSAREAEENGWILIQDTSWPGYEDIPRSIIQGYSTMLAETIEQLRDEHAETVPTHVFVQAGVGALATAVVGAIANAYGTSDEGGPRIVVVEPERAAGIYETLRSDDGQIHAVGGDLDTIMAGLACGEPVTVGIDLLADCVDDVASVPDYMAAQGMRVLSSPRQDGADGSSDPRIISGESGAAPFGFAHEILTDPELSGLADQLGITADSVLLFLSTEGDTDRAGFDAVVHDGAYARPGAPQAAATDD